MPIKKVTKYVINNEEYETERDAAVAASMEIILRRVKISDTKPIEDNIKSNARELIGYLQALCNPSDNA